MKTREDLGTGDFWAWLFGSEQLNSHIKISERRPHGKYHTDWKPIRGDDHALERRSI